MVSWRDLLSGQENHPRRGLRDELTALLPTTRTPVPPAADSRAVTKVALRLKLQIETVIPCQLEEDAVTRAHSQIITPSVVKTAKQAGGKDHAACVVFCLLVCKKWFHKQAKLELWDADMHEVRAVACEIIAKQIIEGEDDINYLFEHVLLKRYSIYVDGEDTPAANAIERAVDLHALTVIGSSGYQKCVNYLWRGWLMQDDFHPARFVPYENKTNKNYWAHVDPDRMRVPRYQNGLQIVISIVYLVLYSVAINTINEDGDLDVIEAVLYIMTFGFICDELSKLWKVGRYYIGFWNVFNSTLYSLLLVSFILRMVSFTHPRFGYPDGSDPRTHYNRMSYDFLAVTAPMFWGRLMLFFDSFRFFGAMLVVTKVMLKESIIFFALLIFVFVGFFQAFVGLDQVDLEVDSAGLIGSNMVKAILTSPEFDDFGRFDPPFGIILYYIYCFVIMTILLNILIALFGSAYESISSNSIDEYMAIFAGKTLQFTRAPDENVYIAPFNLIEIFLLILPFEWWMPAHAYERLNDYVMGFIYSPVLLITAFLEQRDAYVVTTNRRKGEVDEDTVEEWEQLEWNPESEDKEWVEMVQTTSPEVGKDVIGGMLRDLKKDVEELKALLSKSDGASTSGNGGT